MNERKRLMLREEFGPILGSREAVKYLDEKIKDTEHVVLDFKDVEFISRAFAHELWTYSHSVESYSHPHPTIELVNMNDSVKKMWALIDRQLSNYYH